MDWSTPVFPEIDFARDEVPDLHVRLTELREMGRFGKLLESEPLDGLSAGQTYSLADIVKEIHRALNEGQDSHYVVPDDPALIAQELLLFESSGTEFACPISGTTARMFRTNAGFLSNHVFTGKLGLVGFG